MIPLWFLLALAASGFAALGMYMHQRLNAPTMASVVWLKIIALMISIPALITFGLPDHPMFYVLTGLAAVVWCVNDLIYFEAVKQHGAALLARLSPIGLILAFFAWFAVKPDLLQSYMADMPRFIGVCAALGLTVACAFFIRRCAFSWAALKAIWFVIIAAVIGTFLIKSAVDYAPANQSVFGYLGFEAGCMLVFYGVYMTVTRRSTIGALFTPAAIRTGGLVGLCLVMAVICRTYAQKNADHPALVNMISMLDVIWLMVMARMSGWKDDSNKLAGLGIIAAAIMIAVMRIR